MLFSFYGATDLHFDSGVKALSFQCKGTSMRFTGQDLRESYPDCTGRRGGIQGLKQAKRSYCGLPSENVAVETEPVFREIQASLQQDILLECTGIIYA